MATMATSHSLSVLTNSSVKPPLDPSTGLSHTLHERKSPSLGRFTGIFYDDYDEENIKGEIYDTGSKPTFASTADPASILQLSNLSNEEFYQRLLELKNDQRKILHRCEKMYLEKHIGATQPTVFTDEDGPKFSHSYRETVRSQTVIDDDGVLLSSRRSPSPDERTWSQRETSPLSHAESYSKPLSGRPPLPFTAKSLTSPPPRPSSAPLTRYGHAWSTEDLRKTALGLRRSFEGSDEEYIPDDTVSEPYQPREGSKTMSRIEDMWNQFSIEDYAPRQIQSGRPSSATVTRKEKQKKKDGWRHRLTVPEPFNMTVREQMKEKKKSKNMLEFEENMLKYKVEEEEECKKKFKARPVPAQVYLPLFSEIQEQKEERRRQVKHMNVELLKSQEKPFSFLKREDDRKRHLSMSKECHLKPEKPDSESPAFKASPVPKYIFDNTVDDKLLEEEEYRKIRMKMRAEELCRSASLPPSMAAREKMKEQKERENKMRSKRKSHKSTSRPKMNNEMPDYDALYRQFQQELQRRKMQKESTVAKPFHVESRPTKSAIERVKQDIEKDEQTLKENRWPYKLSRTKPRNLGHMSMSLDSLPSKSTKSADVRSSKVRNHLRDLTKQEMREIEEERRRRVKNMRLRQQIKEKTVSRETPRETPSEKKKKFREAERARMEEYEREMQEMKDRVNRRPLLFEHESEINARKKAEKKFNATLRSVGLDEDFVHSRGSRSVSVHDDTDQYDDDFDRYEDETYVKHHQESDRSMSPEED